MAYVSDRSFDADADRPPCHAPGVEVTRRSAEGGRWGTVERTVSAASSVGCEEARVITAVFRTCGTAHGMARVAWFPALNSHQTRWGGTSGSPAACGMADASGENPTITTAWIDARVRVALPAEPWPMGEIPMWVTPGVDA
jgi:hypothetical protein